MTRVTTYGFKWSLGEISNPIHKVLKDNSRSVNNEEYFVENVSRNETGLHSRLKHSHVCAHFIFSNFGSNLFCFSDFSHCRDYFPPTCKLCPTRGGDHIIGTRARGTFLVKEEKGPTALDPTPYRQKDTITGV